MAKIDIEHIETDQDAALEASPDISENPVAEVAESIKAARKGVLAKLPLLLTGIVLVVASYIVIDKRVLEEKAPASSGSQKVAQLSEADSLHQKLSKVLELPSETPNIVTVMDADKVSNQLFFHRAQNGDKVLLYVKAGQAVLYRPSTGKVINLAPINIDPSSEQGAQ